MKYFAIYDMTTGAIVQINGCDSADDVHAILEADHGALEVDLSVTDTTHYVAAGAAVAIPPSPGKTYAWSLAAKSWVDGRSLDDRKADKWAAIKAQREALIVQPKTTSVGSFDADMGSQVNLANVINLTQLAVAKGAPDTVNYTLSTNVRQAFTLEQLQTAALEIGAQVQALFDSASAVRAQIEAATTAAEVDAITWTP